MKDLGFAILACIGGLFLYGLIMQPNKPRQPLQPIAQSQMQSPVTTARSGQDAPEKPVINMAAFQKIQTGMTLEEVEAIVGKGRLQSESEFGGMKTQFYYWDGGFMKGITVTIQDGVVSSKSQIGLK